MNVKSLINGDRAQPRCHNIEYMHPHYGRDTEAAVNIDWGIEKQESITAAKKQKYRKTTTEDFQTYRGT